jgi:hypothetical protein
MKPPLDWVPVEVLRADDEKGRYQIECYPLLKVWFFHWIPDDGPPGWMGFPTKEEAVKAAEHMHELSR